MYEMIAYDVSGVVQIGTVMTALFGVGIVLGILGFSWDSLNAIFGGIPFIGGIFKKK